MAGPWYIVVGGSEIDIDATYGTKTIGMIGTGMPPLTHNVSEQALCPGGLFQSIKVQPRVLQLTIQCWGASLAAFHSIRKDLVDAVKPNYGGTLTPVELRYTGAAAGSKVYIKGYYDGGLEGNREGGGLTSENIVVRFICYDPFWYAMSATTVALDAYKTVSNADYIIRRNSGVWANISTDFGASVFAIAQAIGGTIYLGGEFTNVGDANGDCIVGLNPTTWALSSLSTGIPSIAVYAIAPVSDGSIYVAGAFSNVGDANGDNVVKWTGTAWSSLATGGPALIYTLAVGHDGTLYAGGNFVDFTDANGDNITKWNGTAWSSLGSGVNNSVRDVVVGIDGTLYIAGDFTQAGGVSAGGIAQWNGTSWSAVGSGVGIAGGSAIGYKLFLMADGTLFLGGSFTSVDGVSASNIAKWNGSAWSALGAGLDDFVTDIAYTSSGELYVGGNFTVAGGSAMTDKLAIWDGSNWLRAPVDLPGSPASRHIFAVGDDLYISYNGSGTAYAAGQATVTNGGTAAVYPVVTIKRVGGTTARVEYLKNETTGQRLYLNYSLLDGETLTITLTPGAKGITSDYYGNVIGRALLTNSDFAEWCLQPGANVVSLFVYEAGSPTVTASCVFTAAHWAVDGVAA